MVDYIVGFTDLGNTDDFKTEVLEWRIATQQIIEYDGDLMTRPENSVAKPSSKTKEMLAQSLRGAKKNIRGPDDGYSSDENDWWWNVGEICGRQMAQKLNTTLV